MEDYRTGYKPYTHIIVTGEKSSGNDSVGNMWTITKSFSKETPVSDIIEWANDNYVGGKLIITISEPDKLPAQF